MDSIVESQPKWRPQLRLRTLFVFVTAVAVLLGPAYWFGVAYLVSAAFSVGLVLSCTLAYRNSRTAAFIVASVGAVAGFFFVLGLLVYFGHAALNLVLCGILCVANLRLRTFAISLVALMVAVYGFAFSQGATAMHEIRALQATYPFVSLRERLAFERPSAEDKSPKSDPIQLSPAVATNLDDQDKSFEHTFYSRSGALRELHEQSYLEFTRAAGFGNIRMDALSYRVTLYKPSRTFELPATLSFPKTKRPDQGLVDLHSGAVRDFISPEQIGYVRSRDEVAGFESHQFRSSAEGWTNNNYSPKDSPLWQVVRLELVGLLRDKEPRVYVAVTMPSMDQLADVPHRPLNDFEKSALEKLKTQEDVVINQQTDRILMLGAVRAGTTCLQCHDAERGKLLGAFSYEIVPVAITSSPATNRSAAN